MQKFIHILREMELGLAHLDKPRCIMWYEGECTSMEWLDSPSPEEEIQIKLNLKQKEVELGYNSTKDFPLLTYTDFKSWNY